jgi:sugar O-acyltransferase (sialic acid O-acetyltransferase NeuD family)
MSTPPFATGTTTTNARSLGRDGQGGRPSADIAVPGVAAVELGDGLARTTPRALVLLGGGGHSVVVAEAAQLSGHRIAGFLDDNAAAPLGAILIDLPHPFATPAHLGPLSEHGVDRVGERDWIVALGDVVTRGKVLGRIAAAQSRGVITGQARAVVHPTAIVSPSALISAGVYIGPGAIVHSRVRVGAHAIINSGAIIEHDTVIGGNTHVAPGCAIGGSCVVERDTLIGIGARLLPGVRVGVGVVVGGGAVVIGDVPDLARVVGVPARAM